jgi:hypothetical protein
MKIYCSKCEKCFDDKDIIMDGRDYQIYLVPFCKKCHKEHRKEYGE